MYRYTPWTAAREGGFWLLGAVVVFPVYFVITLSLKSQEQAADSPYAPPTDPTLSNFSDAWNQGGGGTATFEGALVNSVLTTIIVVVLLIAVAAPAGYALGRRSSRMSNRVFGIFILGLILPSQLGFIPLFVFMSRSELTGTRLGLVLVYLGLLMPLAIFLYTGFFRRLPADYEEAAYVDGASPLRTFADIVLPLMRPITGTVALLCGLHVWNDFFTPLVFVGGTDKVTLPVAIYSFVGQYSTEWHLIFASIVVALAPVLIVYVAFQRYIIRGFASGVRG